MKKKNLLKKTKRAARFVLLMFLCFVCTLYIVPIEAEAATYKGYTWTHMDADWDFNQFLGGALNDSDGNIKTGSEFIPEYGTVDGKEDQVTNTSSKSDWYRIMILYSNNQCFTSGNSTCNDNESYLGQKVNTSYGIDVSAETFTTVSGLNTPYIKKAGWDGDNNCYNYFIRFSDNDSLGKTYWNMHVKWYGCAYHAACYCKFDRPGKSVDNWVDNSEWYTYQSFKWSGDKVTIFYNIKGASDRGWEWHGSDGEIECTQDYDHDFRIYIGLQRDIVTYTTEYTLEAAEAPVVWGGGKDGVPICINSDANIVIQNGATLVVDGIVLNSGTFTVEEGGTLVIRGVIDQPTDASGTSGSMIVDGGTLIVEDEGTWLVRNGYATLEFKNNATVEIKGIAVLANGFTLTDSNLRAPYYSALAVGVAPKSTSSRSTYVKSWLTANKSKYYLTDLIDWPACKQGVKIQGKSSVVVEGLSFVCCHDENGSHSNEITSTFADVSKADSKVGIADDTLKQLLYEKLIRYSGVDAQLDARFFELGAYDIDYSKFQTKRTRKGQTNRGYKDYEFYALTGAYKVCMPYVRFDYATNGCALLSDMYRVQ